MKKIDYILCIIVVIVMAILILNECIAIPCFFHKFTGLYCPGCGITRAIKSLLRGDFYSSFRNNMLIYTVIPIMFILEIINIKLRKSKKFKRVYNIVVVVLLIFTIIFGILRNIPIFSWIAPIS